MLVFLRAIVSNPTYVWRFLLLTFFREMVSKKQRVSLLSPTIPPYSPSVMQTNGRLRKVAVVSPVSCTVIELKLIWVIFFLDMFPYVVAS